MAVALIDNAINGLFGALITGGVAVLVAWYTRRSREARQDAAWQKRADELSELIAKQFSSEIAWLRRQLRGCQDENRRLNKILNRQQRGSGDSP